MLQKLTAPPTAPLCWGRLPTYQFANGAGARHGIDPDVGAPGETDSTAKSPGSPVTDRPGRGIIAERSLKSNEDRGGR